MVQETHFKIIAARSLVLIFALTLIFHLLVLTGIVPYRIVWGGRLTGDSEMIIFEVISISLNAAFLSIVLIKLRILKGSLSERMQNIALNAMGVIFLLNTAGNLLSNDSLERMLFTPVTFLISVFCFIAGKYEKLEKNE